MKKILGLGMVALLVMALVGGGTWAYFSDTETSSGNIMTAGTLNLGLGLTEGAADAGAGVTATWTSSPTWAPGGPDVDQTLIIKNTGTIAMSAVNIAFNHVSINGTPATVNGFSGNETDNITKMIYMSVATLNGTRTVFQGTSLYTASTNGTMNIGNLLPGARADLRIVWSFNGSATNGCQGDTETVTLNITATQ